MTTQMKKYIVVAGVTVVLRTNDLRRAKTEARLYSEGYVSNSDSGKIIYNARTAGCEVAR
jgi:hypothetical protein